MNYLETLKNIAKSKDRKIENIVLLVILLVVILLASKYIFKSNTTESKNVSNSTSNKENINNTSENENSSKKNDLETKLANVLSQISGISDVSVVITYSQDTKQSAIYNTKEEQKGESKTTEKTVAYNEDGNKKTAIIESTEMPKIEGAIIVAKGASTVDIRSKIATAVSSLTNVPAYKIQVFEKEV